MKSLSYLLIAILALSFTTDAYATGGFFSRLRSNSRQNVKVQKVVVREVRQDVRVERIIVREQPVQRVIIQELNDNHGHNNNVERIIIRQRSSY